MNGHAIRDACYRWMPPRDLLCLLAVAACLSLWQPLAVLAQTGAPAPHAVTMREQIRALDVKNEGNVLRHIKPVAAVADQASADTRSDAVQTHAAPYLDLAGYLQSGPRSDEPQAVFKWRTMPLKRSSAGRRAPFGG
jgi:hypothetical protein